MPTDSELAIAQLFGGGYVAPTPGPAVQQGSGSSAPRAADAPAPSPGPAVMQGTQPRSTGGSGGEVRIPTSSQPSQNALPTDPAVAGGAGTMSDLTITIPAGLVIQLPPRRLLNDEIVEVVGVAGNSAGGIRVSNQGPNGAQFGPGIVLTATGVPRTINARVLSELWAYSLTAGDQLSVSIRRRANA